MNTIKTPKAEELQSQTSADGQPPTNNNSSELIEREEIPGTPFTIVKTENGYFLAMGIIRLTEDQPTKMDVTNILATEKFNIIIRMMGGMIELNNQYRNKPKTNQQ